MLILPDAPATAIHARKPERTVAEIRAQQGAFRALLAEQPASCTELVADTSGPLDAAVGPVFRAVVSAAHRRTSGAGQRVPATR